MRESFSFLYLDWDFRVVAILEGYDSIIWNEKFNDVGDFEFQIPADSKIADAILQNDGGFIFNTFSRVVMAITKSTENYDIEEGNFLIISGICLLGFALGKRVIPTPTSIFQPTDDRISAIICDLVRQNLGSLAGSLRQWSRLAIGNQTSNNASSPRLPTNSALQLNVGDSLSSVVLDLLQSYGLGASFLLNHMTRIVTFVVHESVDRTLIDENRVVLSSLYDTLVTSSYSEETTALVNTLVVIGNDALEDNIPREIITIDKYETPTTGIWRSESFVALPIDGVIVSGTEERPMTDAEYVSSLTTAGRAELAKPEYGYQIDFEGEVIDTKHARYGKDFFLGDLVIFQSPLRYRGGIMRVESVLYADDVGEGKRIIPSFVAKPPL